MPIIRRSYCVPLPIVVCPVVAVVMLESWVERCVHCVENIACLPQATNSDLLVISSISTCFGHLYAHHQEIRLRSTTYSCLSSCSCCDAGELGRKMCALCGECCLLQAGNILHTLHTSCHPTLQHHNSYNRTDNYR